MGNPEAASQRAGPGQHPPIPHANPNKDPPMISSASIFLFVGISNFPQDDLSATGHVSFFAKFFYRTAKEQQKKNAT